MIRRWKKVGEHLYGYGNGYKAVVYTDSCISTTVLVYKHDQLVGQSSKASIPAAKRWAEKEFLKGA